MAIPALLLLPVAGIGGFVAWRAIRRRMRLRAVRTLEFPPGLRAAVGREHPSLSRGQLERVLAGLRQYLEICARARLRPVAMPSRVVDDAWHRFILFTRDYDRFCHAAFGRYLHHTPHEAMRGAATSNTGLVRCWRIACAIEGIDPRRPSRLPLLFALDGDLGIANGFRYALDCSGPSRDGRPLGTDQGPVHCASQLGCSGGSACSGGSWFSCAGDAAMHGDGGSACSGGSSSDGGSACSAGSGCGGSGCGGGGGD